MSTPEAKVTREELLYLRLKDDIRSGVLLPGTRLMEADLGKTHGISRAIVRTVLRRLEAEGFLKIEPYKGARLPILSLDEIAQVLEIREVLDGLAARMAAERATPEGLEELREVFARLEQAYSVIDVFEYSDLNAEMHLVITTLAANPKLQEIIEVIKAQIVRYVFSSILTAGRMHESLAEHRRLVEAVCSRNGAEAENVARLHVRAVRNNLVRMANDRYPLLR